MSFGVEDEKKVKKWKMVFLWAESDGME